MYRLLQIDDDPADAHLFQAAMKESGVVAETRVAVDGEAALELLRTAGPGDEPWRPDLVLCDLNMPRMNGFEFLEQLAADESLRSIPVIMLSSSPEPTDVSAAYGRQVKCYVCKPVAFEDLCRLVRWLDEVWISKANPAEKWAA